MEYTCLYYPNPGKKKVVFLPGWQSFLPYYFINHLKLHYEVMILLFPGSSRALPLDVALKISDYLRLYKKALDDKHFVPDIRIGHSFGGKILSFLPDKNTYTILISPSAVPLMRKEKIMTKYRIIRNKLMKRIYSVLNKDLPGKYLGSKDYQNAQGEIRTTFLNIKNSYPDKECWKNLGTKLIVIGYQNDNAVPYERLKHYLQPLGVYPILLKGNHYTVFENPNPLLYIMEHLK